MSGLNTYLNAYLEKRDALFRNPNVAEARKMLAEGGMVPASDAIALAAVHKARLAWIKATPDMVAESKAWLTANGFTPSLRSRL